MTHQELTNLLRVADQRTPKQGKPTVAAKRAIAAIVEVPRGEIYDLYNQCSATDEQKIRAILGW